MASLHRMIDSHAHLGVCKPDNVELVADAALVGVDRILTVGMTPDSNREAIEIAEAHEGVFAAVGHHPNKAGSFDAAAAALIRELAAHPKVRAIGETGLDYYRDSAGAEEQVEAFRAQIEIAREAELPLIIHVRDAAVAGDGRAVSETFELLEAEAEGVTVILHCFSATAVRAEQAGANGWLCSFAGNVTYPKAAGLREAAAVVPEDLILVETDSPFLAPQPVRGRPNEPANVTTTAEAVAEARGVGYADLEAAVVANARRIFAW